MATKVICDRCGGEKEVKRVRNVAYGRGVDEYDATSLDKDLCIQCRRILNIVLGKFMDKENVIFSK
jgi:tRNA(Ile)-lysidine synthase TilS/MesJ